MDRAFTKAAVFCDFSQSDSVLSQSTNFRLSLSGSVPVILFVRSGPETFRPILCSVACKALTL